MAKIIGVMLSVLGLAGHIYAAHKMGGSVIAYTHHILGFFLILLVTGGVIVLLGRRFWKSSQDITILVIGVVQALFGLLVTMH